MRELLSSSPTLDDRLIDRILISPRPDVHHLLYDEVLELIEAISREFPELVELESIGQSYEGRDMLLMKIDGNSHLESIFGPNTQKE